MYGQPSDQSLTHLLVTALVVVAVLLLRNRKPRRLRIERLWIRPLIVLAPLVGILAAYPPPVTAGGVALMAAALALGCAIGWQRGRLIRLTVDPATRALTSHTSPIALLFLVALLAGRMLLRQLIFQVAAPLHLPVIEAADALLLLAAGMIVCQGMEMWLRARRLLAEAGAGVPQAGV